MEDILEEIVGNILDEYDEDEEHIEIAPTTQTSISSKGRRRWRSWKNVLESLLMKKSLRR